MTCDVDDPDALTDDEYAQRYLFPHRAALDLRVRALLRGRGWTSRHSDDEALGEKWVYAGSFGGRSPNYGLECGIEPLGLGVEAGPPAMLRVHDCGVYQGCDAHASTAHTIPADAVDLADLLDALERQARAVDPAAVAECVVFGACGRRGRERAW
ncbi:hypothetical protein GCM10027258_81190 [Amycolatopsis stemonae]